MKNLITKKAIAELWEFGGTEGLVEMVNEIDEFVRIITIVGHYTDEAIAWAFDPNLRHHTGFSTNNLKHCIEQIQQTLPSTPMLSNYMFHMGLLKKLLVSISADGFHEEEAGLNDATNLRTPTNAPALSDIK